MKKTLCFTLIVAFAACVQAGDWPHFRGPNHNGSADEKNLPTQWSKTENIAWATDMPGPAAATPIISGEHIFISTTIASEKSVAAMCLDRKTGKILWTHEVAKGINQDARSNFAAPSPTT
ncbi:MAG: PQQ-like beta-propeller repeat protein, partial [Planctomycetales bacterium]